MMAARISLVASDLPDNLERIRSAIERAVPHGREVGRGRREQERFTTVSMLSAEEALSRNAATLSAQTHHVSKDDVARAVAAAERRGLRLGTDQRSALEHVIKWPDLGLVFGFASSGKSAMLGLAKHA